MYAIRSYYAKKWTPAYKQEIIESRVLSTRLLYQSLLKDSFEVKQIISASAIGVYPSSETAIYTEDVITSYSIHYTKLYEFAVVL